MRCPNCGAANEGARFCTYCGTEMPHPEGTQNNVSDNAHQTIINNYYYGDNNAANSERNINSSGRNNGWNQTIYTEPEAPAPGPSKDKIVALLLCVLLGPIGAHHFYVGRWGMGLLYIFTGGLCGIGWFIDFIRIAVGSFPGLDRR